MKDIESIGKELSRDIKTQQEMSDVLGRLVKLMMEGILNVRLDSHLGYEKNEKVVQKGYLQ